MTKSNMTKYVVKEKYKIQPQTSNNHAKEFNRNNVKHVNMAKW